MIIGERLRDLREQKKLPQREIENRSGLQRAYLSRVENGHTVPTIETLEKWAKALEVPIYQLFYDGPEPLKASDLHVWKPRDESLWGGSGQDADYLKQLRRAPPQDRRRKPQTPSPNGPETSSPRTKIRRRIISRRSHPVGARHAVPVFMSFWLPYSPRVPPRARFTSVGFPPGNVRSLSP